jgi:hypothetical protein
MRKSEERDLRERLRAAVRERNELARVLADIREREARERDNATSHRAGATPRPPHSGKCAARSSAIRERSGKVHTLYVNPQSVDLRPIRVTIKGA